MQLVETSAHKLHSRLYVFQKLFPLVKSMLENLIPVAEPQCAAGQITHKRRCTRNSGAGGLSIL
ncbi:hypothetical protein CERSUDRAFT_119925 [Gelatoporia subvermispora B]|uniref:Uncharacterized protein n=1 Tax=Ceriporiopsis subvermispora (strain B) TaxID=914234 RepID=M2QXU4_CERS8|nr:hypothetical protein CERSUDRAFT_119925 [Gelatoporia subvermispora B]